MEQIKKQAVEAAARAFATKYYELYEGGRDDSIPLEEYLECSRDDFIDIAKAAIEAYEAAMWRPISEATKDGTYYLLRCEYEHPLGGLMIDYFVGKWEYDDWADSLDGNTCNGEVTHFRPLPEFTGGE